MSVCIFSIANQIEAGLLKSALDEKNIDNFLKNYRANTLYAGANGNIEVFVKEEDIEKALDIVKALFGDINDAG